MSEYRRNIDPTWLDDLFQGRSLAGQVVGIAAMFVMFSVYSAMLVGAVWFWIWIGREVVRLFGG